MPAVVARKRFAFVIPVYDVAGYLPDLIASIENQTGGIDRLEVIAVDDGSTDNSLGILEEWASRRPGLVTVISKENGGVASARNAGIEHLTAEWVGFVDADDMIEEGYLAATARFLDANPEVDMLATNMAYFDEASGRVRQEHPLRYRFAPGNRMVDLERDPGCFHTPVTCTFLRTDAIRGLRAYADAVRHHEFPASEHTYAIPSTELDALRTRLASMPE